jgi:hypothetical protein
MRTLLDRFFYHKRLSTAERRIDLLVAVLRELHVVEYKPENLSLDRRKALVNLTRPLLAQRDAELLKKWENSY